MSTNLVNSRLVPPHDEAAAADPLDALAVIDLLEVGPARVERDAVTTPYRVVTGDAEQVHELAYRYEEPVFDPASTDDRNLAAMVTAQVALNYGLFCRRIVFRGPFDDDDRRFLSAMLDNTSREIFVKKFLEENPFLNEPVRALPPVQRSSYTRAEVSFEDEPGAGKAPRSPWPVDKGRYAVLSSGGKDSLLSYGLLNELGYDVHSVFVNESGRHWFTALNAYRHFAEHVAGTARVWTSSDRLFSAMVRHLPFVRSDFARLRSDEYPIRLWTVAVFLFGALPILKKRGVGRLLVGDEYDTSVRVRHQGIPHYDGLFDQSRYFDNELSRYFGRKGWGVTQFSVLRPMSEMLIEKTLAERYPELLRLQVSCHAAHKDDGRVRPCGKCEKCRRVAGMLAAVGADPGACGYGEDQVAKVREALVERGVHQERPGAEHFGWLLYQKGLIAEPRLGAVRARKRPEVLRLRIDPRRSPIDGIPVELRRPLFTLLLEHAEGASQWVGRRWVDYDLLRDSLD